MKFTLENKTLMHKELGFLRNTVSEKKATIPALAFTRLEASGKRILRLSATDLDQTLTCETIATVQKTGTIALPTKKLHDIFSELPADSPVVFERKENNRVSVTCGPAKFLIAGLDPADFPELPKAKDSVGQIPADMLATMIERTKFALSRIESQYALAGAKFIVRKAGVRMVTTDGHRLALIDNRTVKNESELDCLIPQNTLLAIARLAAVHEGAVGIAVDDNHIYCEIGARTLIARQLSGQFPNYEMILPKGNDKKVPFECAELLACVRRVSVMADDRSHALQLRFKKNKLTVSAEETESGAAEESLDISFEHKPVTISINSQYLMDYLSVLGNGSVSFEFKEAKAAVNVRSTGEPGFNSYTVIMPLNLPDTATADAETEETESSETTEEALPKAA
ncbi:MAG: DNA polymerase III subunit beta [Pyrinomonadaceae bacterium]